MATATATKKTATLPNARKVAKPASKAEPQLSATERKRLSNVQAQADEKKPVARRAVKLPNASKAQPAATKRTAAKADVKSTDGSVQDTYIRDDKWKLWDDNTFADEAYANLLAGYATVHGKSSPNYKILTRRSPYWANKGTRWYLALEMADGKVWLFSQGGERVRILDGWVDGYSYYSK